MPRDRCSDYDVGHHSLAFSSFCLYGFQFTDRDFLSYLRFWLHRGPLAAKQTKQGLIAVARRSLRFLRHLPPEDLVVMALIEDIDEDKEVEVSKDAWPQVINVNAGVCSVTIALESGAASLNGLSHFPNRQSRSSVY